MEEELLDDIETPISKRKQYWFHLKKYFYRGLICWAIVLPITILTHSPKEFAKLTGIPENLAFCSVMLILIIALICTIIVLYYSFRILINKRWSHL